MPKDYIPLERLLPATDGAIYKLAILAAKRATALAEGEKSLIEGYTEKVLDTALEEIEKKKIREAKGKKSVSRQAEKKKTKDEEEKEENKAQENTKGKKKSPAR